MLELILALVISSASAQQPRADIRCVILDTSKNPQPVVNVVMYETNIDGQIPPGMEAPLKAKCGGITIESPGWSWDGTKFIAPAQLETKPAPPSTGRKK